MIADDTADPALVAADLLSQAEHDVEAYAVLLTTSGKLAEATARAVDEQLATLPRKEIAAESIRRHGVALVMRTLDDALEFAERYAPEHLELMVRDADDVAHRVMQRGRDLRRRLHAGGGGRLSRGAQPRAADGRDGALRVAARGLRLRQAHVGVALGRRGAGGARRRHRGARRRRRLARARARRIQETANERALEGAGAAAAAWRAGVRGARASQRHQARRQRVALSAVARGDGGDGEASSRRSSSTAIPTRRRSSCGGRWRRAPASPSRS